MYAAKSRTAILRGCESRRRRRLVKPEAGTMPDCGGVRAIRASRSPTGPADRLPTEIAPADRLLLIKNSAGSAMAARMAVEDFGGTVLGRRIEILVADHQNKAE